MDDDVDAGRLEPSERLGRYELRRELGAGGMGIVFEAYDPQLDRLVALKVLPDGMMQDAERRSRFLREARAAARLTHTNIATIHDVGEHGGRVFIAMERVAGESLAERLDQGPLAQDEAASIGRDIARALAHAHAAGVVHRDLKPSNVMLGEDGTTKLLDFGIAKVEDGLAVDEHAPTSLMTATGVLMGTPGYMAPEQAERSRVDARADLFALGTVLYEMVTGDMAFAAPTPARRLAATLERDPERLDDLERDMPALGALIRRCLQKDRTMRPASAREVIDVLDPLVDRSSDQRESATIEATTADSRKRGLRLGIVVAVVIGVVAVVWGSTARQGSQSSAAPLASSPAVEVSGVLRRPGATVACPIFEVEGDVELRGQLGAAAANLACEALALFTGDVDATLPPAQLLRLPREPIDAFPDAPYAASEARVRTLAAATEADVILDGTLTLEAERFTLALRARATSATLTATSSHPIIQVAALDAVQQLAAASG
ncbi:MAG: serine/threonine protein kinase, partial [Deltaproteobacteria bacterium]|nr:serine/threonine protein kinase [Deltaproteobacteria bacterium]MBW2534942.1 serine/threonine protein kinase [Deltaproteobacteria bacterium]